MCGFLNSEGGILIWGAPVGKKSPGRKEKVFSGPLTYVDQQLEKDSLVNRLTDAITPMPVGINVDCIGEANQFVYILQVRESQFKPHQFENKYMIRLDGQTRIAPHYYIESMFKQIRKPEIEGYIKFEDVNNSQYGFILNIQSLIFNWSHTHNEKNLIVIVSSPHGAFRDFIDRTTQQNRYHEYHFNGHQSLSRHLDDTLFYGSPIIETFSIVFSGETVRSGTPVELILRFGGDSSPQKESYYKFRFLLEGKTNVEIIESIENVLVSEIRDVIGKNKEETIKYYLKI